MLTVYSKTSCPTCTKAKMLLRSYVIEYTDINIDKDEESKQFLIKQGHNAVPQLYVGDKYFGDYEDLANMTESEIEEKVEKLGI